MIRWIEVVTQSLGRSAISKSMLQALAVEATFTFRNTSLQLPITLSSFTTCLLP